MTIHLHPRQAQIHALLVRAGFADATLAPLPGDASFRRYMRVNAGTRKAMLMDAPPEKETVAPFLAVARHLSACGYSAPEVLGEDAPHGLVLLEDLGDDLFTRVLASAQDAVFEQELYAAAIDLLVAWHRSPLLNDARALPLARYDHELMTREVLLFSEWYLPQVMEGLALTTLQKEFQALWAGILERATLATNVMVHRDYHADNLMWLPEREGHRRVGLLDFQDAVYGDGAYDLVSLLEDARRDVPEPLAREMVARYVAGMGIDAETFASAYALLGAQRNCKIVGIFARLAVRDHKPNYLRYLPRVWAHLAHDVAHPHLAEFAGWLEANISVEHRGAELPRLRAAVSA